MIARMVKRALAQRLEHRVAARLDALGDLDLALAREQLDRAHLAQVHAHRIVGAAEILVERGGAVLVLVALQIALGRGAVRLAAADAHAHFLEHGDQLVDHLGRDLVLGQGRVDLVMGDEATLPGLDEDPLDRRDIADQFLKSALQALAGWRLRRRDDTCCSLFRHAVFPSQPAGPSSERRAHAQGHVRQSPADAPGPFIDSFRARG